MRRALLTLTATALLLAPAPVQGQKVLYVLLRDYLESLRTQAGIPALSAALVGEHDILWEYAFGRQDLERSVAARTDTPFHLDGLTQTVTAALVLRCIEEGHLSLEDRIGAFAKNSPEPDVTVRQILTHTSGSQGMPAFAYKLERLDPLAAALAACRHASYREIVAELLDQLAMTDSVPGQDVVELHPAEEGFPEQAQLERYRRVLERLATPYAVDAPRRAVRSQYAVTTLQATGGLVSTVRDFAQFDLALKQGVLLRPETLSAAWQAPLGPNGQALPHGLGWFVQIYNGEPIVWQFGVGENASSSLVITVPGRGLTLVLLASSDRLVTPFPLAAGDLTVSPFARVFLGLFVR